MAAEPVAIEAELVSSLVSSSIDLLETTDDNIQPHQLVDPATEPDTTAKLLQDHQQQNQNKNGADALEFQQGDDTIEINDDNDDNYVVVDDLLESSFWDLFAFCSGVLSWLRQSMVSVFRWIRSLVLGHCLRFLLSIVYHTTFSSHSNNNSDNDNSAMPHHQQQKNGSSISDLMTLLYNLLLVGGGSGGQPSSSSSNCGSSSKQVHAWPPPALVVLATLTIVALVVHPDGMTWIALGKIRDTMLALLESSTTCWTSMVRDYGIVKTISASASIAVVLVLAIVMHKAFLPNCCLAGSDNNRNKAETSKRRHNTTTAEKKRRRRRGNHAGGRGGKIKGASTSSIGGASPSMMMGGGSPLLSCPRLPKVEEVLSIGGDGGGSGSDTSSIPNLEMEENGAIDNDPTTEGRTDEQEVDGDVKSDAISEEGASITTSSPSALESVVSLDDTTTEVKGRGSIPSVCTVDTMADDISCGSMSVRSGPPRLQQQQQQLQPISRGTSKKGNPNNNARVRNAVINNTNNTNTNTNNSNNNKWIRGQKQPTVNEKMLEATTPPRPDSGKVNWQGVSRASNNSSDAGSYSNYSNNNKKCNGQKQNRGGRGRGGNNQNPRGGRGQGSRSQKSRKNQQSTNDRVHSPSPTSSAPSTTHLKSDFTVISTSSSLDSSSLNGNNGIANPNSYNHNRLPPVSPYSQSLFSCEVGNSGWSLPVLPSNAALGTQNLLPNLAATTQTSPALMEHYSQLPSNLGINSGASAELNCGLWNTGANQPVDMSTFGDSNSTQTTPQRPLRAPPGFVATPIKQATTPNFYTPIGTPANHFSNSANYAPSQMPVTPAFGTPNVGKQQQLSSSYSPWSGINGTGSGNTEGERRSQVTDNPFAVAMDINAGRTDDADCRIEAELQKLGGRMVGSILDF